MSFVVLDHDADLRLEIDGSSEQEMYENAARAIFSLITDPARVHATTRREITVGGNGELLINFLNELIYIWDAERFLPNLVTVSFHENGLNATLTGEEFDPERHEILLEMKAVTYHDFSIRQEEGKYKAIIVVDV
ncbi:MAG: archease [Syntrophorhabdaceae bacterium]